MFSYDETFFSLNSADELKTCQSLGTQQRAMIALIEANFTQTVQYLSQERDSALKDRDVHHQDAITLRKENIMAKEQLSSYTRYSLSVLLVQLKPLK